jgi:hypothetical protein
MIRILREVQRETIIQLCPVNMRVEYCGPSPYKFRNFINYVAEYIDVEGASCPGQER